MQAVLILVALGVIVALTSAFFLSPFGAGSRRVEHRRTAEVGGGSETWSPEDDSMDPIGRSWPSPDNRDSHYRVPPGASLRGSGWNPYAGEQSRVHRVRQTRQQAKQRGRERQVRNHLATDVLDYYAALGVSAEAGRAELERAYRREVARIHPDKFYADPSRQKQAEAALKRLNEAMQLLRDPVARAEYDARRR